jgi:putative flavoprotein involved in K+ transport
MGTAGGCKTPCSQLARAMSAESVAASDRQECVVIGSGPAGLAAAAMLHRAGIPALVLERADDIAPSWRSRYDGFRLNTSSWFSFLPGRRLPRRAGRWPTRDALVAYYESYAREHALRIELGTAVERIDRADHGWRVRTLRGTIEAACVVVATGKYRTPVVPAWPGRDGYTGELIHSAAYRNPKPYHGRDVMVVGPGASGCEIAMQIARAAGRPVCLSIRTPPHVIHREIGPVPTDLFAVIGRRLPVALVDAAGRAIRRLTIGDLRAYGLPPPEDGIYTRLKRTGMIPTADGPYVEALKAGLIEVVPAVERFDGSSVILADGSRWRPDAVIAATGYRRDLEPLVGHLGVLTDDGHPVVHGRRTDPRAPGLYFIGFSEPLSGNLREVRLDARRIARVVKREILGRRAVIDRTHRGP